MIWHDILRVISKLTALNELSITSCANALECNFELTAPNRYRSHTLQDPFEYAELIFGNDKARLTLTFNSNAAREEYAMRMLSLGKPINIEIVSPPMADEKVPKTKLNWDRKYSLCFEIGDRPVWFGIEETESRKKLINISIHQPDESLTE